jgi:SAM-dependent methyltransferase
MKSIVINEATVNLDQSAWFKKWFDSSFYHQLYANRDENEAAQFIDALIAQLMPLAGSSILDLGCGNGRHSRRLADKGFDVTGIDLAASSISFAKRFSRERLCFYKHDMRNPFGVNLYNYVFNCFTSFGYFKTQAENVRVVRNITDSLKDGGTLIMDYLNVRNTEDNLVPAGTKEIDGIHYRIERWATDTHFFKRIEIDTNSGAEPMVYTEQVEKLHLSDFDILFKKSGLKIEQVFGDYALNDYDALTSPRLIMIARKED